MLLAASASKFCQDTAGVWGLLGYVVLVLKIAIPLILIVLGMVDFGKAVVSDKEDEISKSVNSLLRRFIAAIVVFLIPWIVSAIFNLILGSSISTGGSVDSGINRCVQCVVNRTGTKNADGTDACTSVGIGGDPYNDSSTQKTTTPEKEQTEIKEPQ